MRRHKPSRTRAPDRPSRGALGEAAAARALRSRGYRIVARNLRTRTAEIDLLIRRRRLFVAVEVKTRTRHPAPERAVDTNQLERLSDALYRLAPTLEPRPHTLRVDVVAVRLHGDESPEVLHLPGHPFSAPPRR